VNFSNFADGGALPRANSQLPPGKNRCVGVIRPEWMPAEATDRAR
jgi:hypothetical protein